jgi:hypothetical protein
VYVYAADSPTRGSQWMLLMVRWGGEWSWLWWRKVSFNWKFNFDASRNTDSHLSRVVMVMVVIVV